MSKPKLIIRKRRITHQGKTGPAIHVQAVLDPAVHAQLLEHFGPEMVFKKAMLNGNLGDMVHQTLASTMANFLKNDACPEITVKTLLGGQLYQANTIWEIMCFEVAAKFAFEALLQIMSSVLDFGAERYYFGWAAAEMEEAEAKADAEFERVYSLGTPRAVA